MNKKRTALIFLFVLILLPLFVSAAGSFDYTPLEKIPGSDTATSTTIDFYAYVYAIYKFGIWAVGIVALFMLVFGGYTYITSAGNNSSMETAKKIITDAIVGIIMALTAYLLLYVINPDLVKMKRLTPAAGVPVVPPVVPPGAFTCTDGKCSQINSAIQNNASGVDPNILKSLFVAGEGCNSSNSPKGACGYSQVMPLIRNAYCNGASCSQLQADTQLDINCGAAYIKAEIQAYCKGDPKCTGSCYNLGMTICKKNTTNCGENNYCQRVQSYYNGCAK